MLAARQTASPPFSGLAEQLIRFAPRLRLFLRRRVRCAATADDLTQETLAKAWQRLPQLRESHRLEAWLYRMARNTLVDHFRRRRPELGLDDDVLATDGDAAAQEISSCVARAARCYLGTLPAIYQEAVRLAEEEDLSHAEVAGRLGISLTAVKSRIQRGRQLLRERLESCCRFEFDRRGRVVGWSLRAPCKASRSESGCGAKS